ncbi:peroxiredoxin-5, mitochondrial-like [Mya arenaria]|uniref:peroxiredoxin-5, mitochondrial-like n=1 Tax=Mya arenaria TaxID=6604 RepID=UPI0022E3F6F8|nr:peroxiredoxin-5, mitochondrial-like [Mya arenaria]
MRTLSRVVKLLSNNSNFIARGIRTSQASIMAPIKVGEELPNVDLFEGNPDGKVNTKTAFGKGKHVIVAVVGAFTPTCENQHMPTFVADFDKIKAKGVDSINCVSVNDPFVMEAFGKKFDPSGKVRCLADTCGTFTKAVDLELDVTAILGRVCSKRYAMVVQDGKVTGLNVEDDSSKATCTRGEDIMSLL